MATTLPSTEETLDRLAALAAQLDDLSTLARRGNAAERSALMVDGYLTTAEQALSALEAELVRVGRELAGL